MISAFAGMTTCQVLGEIQRSQFGYSVLPWGTDLKSVPHFVDLKSVPQFPVPLFPSLRQFLGCFLRRGLCYGRFRGRGSKKSLDRTLQAVQGNLEVRLFFFRPGGGVNGVNLRGRLITKIKNRLGCIGVCLRPGRLSLLLFGLASSISLEHGAGLLFPGNLKQCRPGDLPVSPAFISDFLGQFIQGHDLRYRGAGLADDAAELLVRVFLFLLEALKGLRLLDGEIILGTDLKSVPLLLPGREAAG